jgi:hypothetical protein
MHVDPQLFLENDLGRLHYSTQPQEQTKKDQLYKPSKETRTLGVLMRATMCDSQELQESMIAAIGVMCAP